MNWHWRASIALSRALCGPAEKPLCARIHEAPQCRARSVAMFMLDLIFGEYQHCAQVHRRWLSLP